MKAIFICLLSFLGFLACGCDTNGIKNQSSSNQNAAINVDSTDSQNLGTTETEEEVVFVSPSSPVSSNLSNRPISSNSSYSSNSSEEVFADDESEQILIADSVEEEANLDDTDLSFDGIAGDDDDDSASETSNVTTPDNMNVQLFCQLQGSSFYGTYLKTSKWGPVGLVQSKLGLEVDGIFGGDTTAKIMEYQQNNGLPKTGCVDTDLWKKMFPQKEVPTYKDRAWQLTFLMENTDYDCLEFNFGTSDDSGMTWGPMGMTLASGEIQNILRIAIVKDASSIRQAVGDDVFDFVNRLSELNGSNGMTFIKRYVWDKGESKRNKAKEVFKKLATVSSVRTAFRKIAVGSINTRFEHYLEVLKSHQNVTELDWAFFWDVATQTGYAKKKSTAVSRQSVNDSNPKQRRRIWGDVIADQVKSAYRKNRIRRNEMFYKNTNVTAAYGLQERAIRL
jgi:peptidoglycan hydrolase-like protein with peptidoglycan-binding domain